MSDYMRGLREKVGHDYVLVPTAAALIRDGAGRVLLVRHVEGRWQLPGDAVDPDEHPEESVRRECLEEASIEVRPLRILGVYGGPGFRSTYANGDEVGTVSTLYEAEIVSGTPHPGDDETQDVGWFAPAELEALGLRATSLAALRTLLA